MANWLSTLLTLAADPKQNAFNLGDFLPPMMAIGLLWYFLLFRPQQRERAKRNGMLGKLKKNDRVVTIGGIIGSVASVSADNEEVTLKVDDNTRIKMLRSSISRVLGDATEEDAAKK